MDVRPNIEEAPFDHLQQIHDKGNLLEGKITHVGILPNGTVGGAAAAVLLVETSDGKTVVAQTTLGLFAGAARALLASPVAVAEGLG